MTTYDHDELRAAVAFVRFWRQWAEYEGLSDDAVGAVLTGSLDLLAGFTETTLDEAEGR